jgi:hypothetical protein
MAPRKLRITTSKRVHVSMNSAMKTPRRLTLSMGQVIEKREKSQRQREADILRKPLLVFIMLLLTV